MIRFILMVILIILLGSTGMFLYFANSDESSIVTVTIVPVQNGYFTASVSAEGKLIARNKEQPISPINGIIHDNNIEIGKYIFKGTEIASIRLPEFKIKEIEQNLEFALIDLDLLNEQLFYKEELLQAKAASLREVKELRIRKYKQEKYINNLKESLKNKPVYSNIDGLIVEKNSKTGDNISAGSFLCTIIDTNSYCVEISVPQHIISSVVQNQRLKYISRMFTTDCWGIVLEIAKLVDSQKDQYSQSGSEAKFNVIGSFEYKNKENILLGSKITVQFITGEKPVTLFVPAESILYRNNTPVVFLAKRGVAHQQNVKLGLYNDNYIEIIDGVTKYDSVITFGNLDVEDGVKIKQRTGKDDTKIKKLTDRTFFFMP